MIVFDWFFFVKTLMIWHGNAKALLVDPQNSPRLPFWRRADKVSGQEPALMEQKWCKKRHINSGRGRCGDVVKTKPKWCQCDPKLTSETTPQKWPKWHCKPPNRVKNCPKQSKVTKAHSKLTQTFIKVHKHTQNLLGILPRHANLLHTSSGWNADFDCFRLISFRFLCHFYVFG